MERDRERMLEKHLIEEWAIYTYPPTTKSERECVCERFKKRFFLFNQNLSWLIIYSTTGLIDFIKIIKNVNLNYYRLFFNNSLPNS